MKTKLFFSSLFIIASCITATLHGQEATEVKELSETLVNESVGNALTVKVHRTKGKKVLSELKSEMKKRDGDVKIRGGEMSALSVIFPSISTDTIEVFAKLKELSDNDILLFVVFMKDDKSVSSERDISAYTAARLFLHEFANNLSLKATEKFFNEESKDLKSLQNKLKNEKRNKEKAEKSIVKTKKKTIKEEFILEKLNVEEEVTKEVISKKDRSEKTIANLKKKHRDLEYELVENEKTQKELVKKIESKASEVKSAKKELNVFK